MQQTTPPEDRKPDIDTSLDALLKIAFLDEVGGVEAGDLADSDAAFDGMSAFGHFRILRELGRGGMGVVYLAEDLRLHRNVAIKVLTAFAAHSPSLRKRLLREAEAASKLDHPTICNVHEVGEANGQPFIAMQYVEGETLAKKIAVRRTANEGRSSADTGSSATTRREEVLDTVKLVETVARALHAAHESGLVHRDIKPANIMVTTAGAPVLLDFGLARDVETEDPTLTQTGQVMGTPGYMAPEQLRGERTAVDRRVDVYALGVTLYECLTMQRPFHAATREQLYARIFASDPPDPRRRNPAIPRDLRVVLDTALEKDPDRRYQSTEDFADDLRRVREQRPIHARPVSPAGRLIRWARRRPARAALVLVLVIAVPLLAGLGGYLAANLTAIEEKRARDRAARVELNLEDGFSHIEHGSPEHAHRAFDAALEVNPASVEAVAGKALLLLDEDRAQDCLALLDDRSTMLDAQPMLHNLRNEALRDLGREKEIANTEHEPRTDIECFLAGMRLMADCDLQTGPEGFQQAVALFRDAALRAKVARRLYHIQIAHAAGHLARFGKTGTRSNFAPPEPDHAKLEVCRSAADALTCQWPDSPDAWYWAGFALVAVDRSAACASCRHAVKLDPDLPRAWNIIATVQRLDGNSDEAHAAYKKVAELLPRVEPSKAALGYLALGGFYCENEKHKNLPEAIRLFQKALALRPNDHRIYHNLSRAYLLNGQLQEATEACKQRVALVPRFFLARYMLGAHFFLAADFHAALAEYDQVLKQGHGRFRAPDMYIDYAEALAKTGRRNEAIDSLEKAIELGSRNVAAVAMLAPLLLDHKDTRNGARAAQILENGRRLWPTASRITFNLGRARFLNGEWAEAVSALRETVRLAPDCARAHALLPVAMAMERDPGHSAAKQASRIALQPELAGPYSCCESSQAEYDTWVQASSGYRQRIEAGAADPSVYCLLGLTLVQRGEFEDALPTLLRGHQLGRDVEGWNIPSGAWLHDCRLMLAARGEPESSAKPADQPSTPDTDRVLAKVAFIKGNYRSSAALYQRAFDRTPGLASGQDPFLGQSHRYAAALAAGLAAYGGESNPGVLDAEARVHWRKRALAWLEADLQSLRTSFESIPAAEVEARRRLTGSLVTWRARWRPILFEPEALARLPAEERRGWLALWQGVLKMVEQLERHGRPPKNGKTTREK